jgi:hypothetical protein
VFLATSVDASGMNTRKDLVAAPVTLLAARNSCEASLPRPADDHMLEQRIAEWQFGFDLLLVVVVGAF